MPPGSRSQKAVKAVALEKLLGSRFGGNAYTEHGLLREPHIGRWANSVYGMQHSAALFHADGNRDHLATPDGLRERDGILELCEIKTTASAGAASRGTICGRSGGSSTC